MPVKVIACDINEEKLSYIDRVKLRNKLQRYTPDLNVFAADSAVFEEAVSKRFVLTDVFQYIVTGYAFVLCFFQILIAVSQNLKETGWQLGVLRAIGITKSEKFKIAQIEAFVNISVALGLGIGIGSFAAYIQLIQYTFILELPMYFFFPVIPIVTLVFCSFNALFVGTSSKLVNLNRMSIATLLKQES